jgi:N-acetylglucosamine kinase-like BadF-type ATPase
MSARPRTRPFGDVFLGVDGGGTRTRAVLVDAAGVCWGEGEAGTSNYRAAGLPRALAHLRQAVERAAAQAGVTLPCAGAMIGLAGVDGTEDRARLLPYLVPLARAIALTNDAELVLSALPDGVGVALIAGTGSIAIGRDTRGTIARAGGWGHLLGDEGSGFALGREALRAALRAGDGRGEPTLLRELIAREWGTVEADGLLAHAYGTPGKAHIARLAPLVFTAARAGDPLARGLVRSAATELAQAVLAVGAALDFGEQPLPLALGGGLLLENRTLRGQVVRRLRRRRALGPVSVVRAPALSAARAALCSALVASRHAREIREGGMQS